MKTNIDELEWVKIRNWRLLKEYDSYWIKKKDINLFIECIISLCISDLKCERQVFENAFKRNNKEFLNLKDKLFKWGKYFNIKDGRLAMLMETLYVPANIKLLMGEDKHE